jgi:hypothetical protein
MTTNTMPIGAGTGTPVSSATTALATVASQINQHHKLACTLAGQAVSHAIEAGKLLLSVKESLPHGGFGDWVANNLDVSARQAQRYMGAAQGKPLPIRAIKYDTVSYLDWQSEFEKNPVDQAFWRDEPGLLGPVITLLHEAGRSYAQISLTTGYPAKLLEMFINPVVKDLRVHDTEGVRLKTATYKNLQKTISSHHKNRYQLASELATTDGRPDLSDQLKTLAKHYEQQSNLPDFDDLNSVEFDAINAASGVLFIDALGGVKINDGFYFDLFLGLCFYRIESREQPVIGTYLHCVSCAGEVLQYLADHPNEGASA